MYRRKRKGNNKEKKRHEKTQRVFESESQKETLWKRLALSREREEEEKEKEKEEEMMELRCAPSVTLEIDLVCHHYRAISIHYNLEIEKLQK